MANGLHRLKFWGAQQIRATANADADMGPAIAENLQMDGVAVLSGHEATLQEPFKTLLQEFSADAARINADAEKAGAQPAPTLFTFHAMKKEGAAAAYDDEPAAYSSKLPDGKWVVGISDSMVHLLSQDHRSVKVLAQRLRLLADHEGNHAAKDDLAIPDSDHEAKRQAEYKADRETIKITCDAKTFVGTMEIIEKYEAGHRGMGIDDFNNAIANTPTSDYPPYSDRMIQAKKAKKEFSKACQAPVKP